MIGDKIKLYKEQKGLSSKELAEKASISASYISRVQKGEITPSIDVLRRIAKALDIPVFHLLIKEGKYNSIKRKDDRKIIKMPKTDLTYEIISSNPNNKMGIMKGKMGVGAATAENLQEHSGEECILIISGKMKVELPSKEYILNSGDSLYLDSTINHRLINPGKNPCIFHLMLSPPRF